jgi:hypothetical protein
MAGIDKLTQGFDAAEDRLFIDVRLSDGEERRLWLTQRLAGVLVQHLCSWLDDQLAATASGHHDTRLHAFEQQAAAAALNPETAVAPAKHAVLVHSVDVDRGNEAVRLTFRATGEATGPAMTLDATRLRQWLGILRGLCAQAGWPTGHWPVWLANAPTSTGHPANSLH